MSIFLWCLIFSDDKHPSLHRYTRMCSDNDAPDWGQCGNSVMCGAGALAPANSNTTKDWPSPWVRVNVASEGSSSVAVDLSPLQGATPRAIRYAWGNDNGDSCCPPKPEVKYEYACFGLSSVHASLKSAKYL